MTVVASRSCCAGPPSRVGFALLLALVFTACGSGGGGSGGGGGGGAGPAIYNGSFEVLGGNADGKQPDGWIREGMDTLGYGVARKTGSGFMPTDGQYFTEFPAANDGGGNPFVPYYPTLVMYQDDVDLSAATSLVFDYETTNIAIQAGSGPLGHDASATVRIYFQPNSGGGTVDLWVKSYGPGAVPEQVLGQSATLPTLVVPGRLAIEVTTTLASAMVITPTTLTFRLDSLAAQ